jgi:putative ABC transport system ATP-binding protein
LKLPLSQITNRNIQEDALDIIEIKGLKKNYPLGTTTVRALRGVDLTIREGELVSIVGPSGSGKTTLLNVIGCVDHATEGSVKVGGVEITELDDRSITDIRLHKIGFIFQTFNLIPVLDVIENVEFPLLLMKQHTKEEVRTRAEKLIDNVGLTQFAKHRPAELSGGQRQRVAIARALVTNPDIVLADEPTANLDSVTGAQILELMSEMNRIEKTTFIFSTHDEHVLKYASGVIKIKDGVIAGD